MRSIDVLEDNAWENGHFCTVELEETASKEGELAEGLGGYWLPIYTLSRTRLQLSQK